IETAGVGQGTTGAITGGPASIIGADIAGSFVKGLHIEATAEAGLPLKMIGESHVQNLLISTVQTPTPYAHSHLIEVDETSYSSWSLTNIKLSGPSSPVVNGMIKLTPSGVYKGGTTVSGFEGQNSAKTLNLRDNLYIKEQARQSFALRLENQAGTIK